MRENIQQKFLIFFFGLSATNGTDSDYVYGEPESKVPTRWVAPEVLTKKNFSEYSDIWSFGVTVWEILENGARPYWEKESNEEVKKFVFEGGRLSKPDICPPQLWNILVDCWKKQPSERTPFKNIVELLCEQLVQEETVKKEYE